jgi:cytoskeletal protein CcmA (bactofilin family)
MLRGTAASRSTTSGPAETAESTLGRGARVRGRITGDGDLRVEGHVEGDVRISGQLSLEEGASVTGDVDASVVVIGGALTGDVTSRGAVTVRATAQVQGNLGGAEVSLEEGASFHGRIEAEFDMPAELEAAPEPVRAETRSGRSR